MIYSIWKNAVITIATDDDLSAAVDLEKPYERLLIILPTLTATTVAIHVSDTEDGTFVPLGNSVVIASSTGEFADSLRIGGYQFIKIKTSAGQAANRTFKIAGVRS